MCPWCLLTPLCPCHHSATLYAAWLTLATAVLAAARRPRGAWDAREKSNERGMS